MTERSQVAAKLILLGFVALFVVFFSMPHGMNRAPKVGDAAPAFSIPNDKGKPVSLADFRGKIVVVNFWATWCPPCIDELPSLNRLAERYSDKGLQVVGVSLDEDPEAYRKFLTQNRIAFLTVRNPSRAVSEEYGTYKLPESYIISRDGRLLDKIIGAADWTNQDMISYFEGLLAGS